MKSSWWGETVNKLSEFLRLNSFPDFGEQEWTSGIISFRSCMHHKPHHLLPSWKQTCSQSGKSGKHVPSWNFQHIKGSEKSCNKETCLDLLNYTQHFQNLPAEHFLCLFPPSPNIQLNTSNETDLAQPPHSMYGLKKQIPREVDPPQITQLPRAVMRH